ncbi:MAG TPA: phosphoadenylyl-sulfate reductase [Gemmatimonadales bacterium]|nr:phosphoadenylyl-sulfate reductase [Gemmatimonadales bacterium]
MAELEPAPIAEDATPGDVIAWALGRYADRQLVVTTAFGLEGCALLDMVAMHGREVRVVWVDTGFLFPETYRLRDRIAARYPHLRFERRATSITPETQDALQGPELWRRDPDLCCRLRKVIPLREVLREADVWMTGLTRSQSAERAATRVVEWDTQFEVVKVNPLAAWDRPRVWEYVQSREVPYNELHERGYPTLGCTHCTTPVAGASVTTYSRAGRWAGTTKTECGLHPVTREFVQLRREA